MTYDVPFSEGGDWNLDALYADRVATGALSERPSAADAPDEAVFVATDQGTQGVIYRNDPSNGWVVVVDESAYYDAGNDALTADVDNESVTTDELLNGVAGSGNTVTRLFGERISSKSPSGVSAVEFTSGINSDYNRYVVELSDIVSSSDDVDLQLQVSTDGGSTWKTGADDYAWTIHAVSESGATGTTASSSTSAINVNRTGLGAGSGESLMATVGFSSPASAANQQLFDINQTHIIPAGGVQKEVGSGRYKTAEAIDAIRLKFSSGNIESGNVDLLGVMG